MTHRPDTGLAGPLPSPQPRGREVTGAHVLAALVGFFAIVIAVNGAMAVLAAATWTGLIVPNSYVASQRYNEAIAADRQQQALGWRLALEASTAGLAVVVSARDGRPVTGLDITADLARPTHERDDRRLGLVETAGGRYSAETALQPGLWIADIEAIDDARRRFRQQLRVVIRPRS